MNQKRYLTEMGMGVDVHGGDYTKAAKRAVSDAIRHSSINFFPHIEKSRDDMLITLVVGAQEPEQIDTQSLVSELPYGQVSVKVELGGLDIPAENGKDKMVIVNVAVLVGCSD